MKSRLMEVFVFCCALVLRANAQNPIISEPQSITVNNASAATFTVVATNAVSYQWQFQGANVSGATNTSLSLDDVSTNEAGSYTVVVTLVGNTSVTSSPPAILTIVPGTIIQWTISTYPGGGSSNFTVQLFDHDKPATVENFIHYITSGAYSNMWFERDAHLDPTNSVLQGGEYVTSDRSSSNFSPSAVSVGTNFPSQVDNEFSVGPLIHNKFGTLAMAFSSTNSATKAFFFNLSDNSAILDVQDFTVFGRILPGTGTNVLEYFNTLYADHGIYTNYGGIDVGTIPVNYDGTNAPTDASFFYCDFSFLSPPPVDTVPPTVSITYPAPNAALTNGTDLTATGTASDNVAVAEVYCVLTPLTGFSEGESQTNAAIGTANWSLDLGTNPPGVYELQAYAEDGAGNLSAPATQYFTNLAVLTIITNVNGQLTTNQQYVVPGQTYSLTATPPSTGDVFLNWQNQGVTSLDPVQEITTDTNLTITVTFTLTDLPPGLAITNPVAGSINIATNAALTISGTVPANVTNLTVQLFLNSNAVTAAQSAIINGSTWSLAEIDLAGGLYTAVAVAEDSLGDEGIATDTFTVKAPPIIYSEPSSITNVVGFPAEFSVGASNAVSYQWQLIGTGSIAGATNATLIIADVTTNLSGSSYEVVITSADNETVTSTPATLTVVAGSLVQITFSGFPDGSQSNVLVQLFDHEKPATVANFLHYITPAIEVEGGVPVAANVAFSNMIWDRCIPGFVLQGGGYSASDQTNTAPPPHLQPIESAFTQNLAYSPAFPFNIDNEFGVGPVIHNTFGTLAMAKTAGQPDSAANAFFFNLADNSSNLDNQNGGYTVFGQILSGSNVLEYFNTLSKPNHGIFDYTTLPGDAPFPDLPVNYDGWQSPADSNLFFATFTLLTAFNPDTTPPTVTLSYPINGETITNADVVFEGTASDNVAVARVVCTLDGNAITATGTTNWITDFGTLSPGTHSFRVVAQDGSGNITASSNAVSGTFVVPRFPFEASVNGNGTLSTNLDGTNTTVGSRYGIAAEPNKGAVFLNWVAGTNASLSRSNSFTMLNGLQMTANFISNVVSGGISITFPSVNGEVTGSNFTIKGRMAASLAPAQVTCQVFSASTSNSVSAPLVFNASGAWSSPSVSLPPGNYIVQAIAQSANGKAAVAYQSFSVLAQLTIVQYGQGRVTMANGTYLKLNSNNKISAVPAAGYSFLSWNAGNGSIPVSSLTFPMTEGLTLTATFVPNSLPGKITFTTPVRNRSFTNLNVTLGGKVASSVVAPQVFVQVFQNDSAFTGFMQATMNGDNWTLPLSNLTTGGYNAVAMVTDATGKTTTASDVFTVNFFPLIAGSYHGLFFNPESVSLATSGTILFSLNDFGQVFGQVTFAQQPQPYILYVQVGSTGSVTAQGHGTLQTINLQFNFDMVNYTGVMNGYIDINGALYPMTAYRAMTKLGTNTAPSSGTYVLNLAPSSGTQTGPPGDSFADVVASPTGLLAVAGTMADSSTFSFSTGVYTNGVWPMFATFYKGNGMVIGWETNLPSGVCNGALYWVKNPTNGIYYTNGINEQINSFGSKYVPPVAGTNYQIVFTDGSLQSPLTNIFSFKNGAIIPADGTTDSLTGTLTSKGVLKGSIINPANSEKLPFNGAFISPTEGGAGFTLDVDRQTGYFEISLAPE
jgi:cyclophilin family peptidyl-prolyl cis-trans isomerase